MGEATCSLKMLRKGICHPVRQPWRRRRAPDPREEAAGERISTAGGSGQDRALHADRGAATGGRRAGVGGAGGAVPGSAPLPGAGQWHFTRREEKKK